MSAARIAALIGIFSIDLGWATYGVTPAATGQGIAAIFSTAKGYWVGIDLAGLAITSDLGGILLQGGLRKFGSGDTVQYVGMLMARFGVYGLSVFGGYGQGVQDGQRYSSFLVAMTFLPR